MNVETPNVVAILIGRGGSSFKDKNIFPVLGRPLLDYQCIAALNSKYIKNYYVSSDNNNILDAAARYGYKKIKRPAFLATNNAQSPDVLTHALEIIKKEINPEYIVLQHANVATITSEIIDDCLEIIFKDNSLDSVIPVHSNDDFNPYRAKKIIQGNYLENFFNNPVSANRQDLPKSVFPDHNIWVLNRQSVDKASGLAPWPCMGSSIKAYLTSGCFDVHDIKDIQLSEDWLLKNNQKVITNFPLSSDPRLLIEVFFKIIKSKLNEILSMRSNHKQKSDGSIVTEADIYIQDLAKSFFSINLKNHKYISEEEIFDLNPNSEEYSNSITIDPIDGTENFFSGLKEWGIGISIYSNGKHKASGIFLPELNELVISGDTIEKFSSRIEGLSSSLNIQDLISIQEKRNPYETRIIGCSMYNMLNVIKGSFTSFENIKGVNSWDLLPGINLALEHGLKVHIDSKPYNGELLLPTKKYKVFVSNE